MTDQHNLLNMLTQRWVCVVELQDLINRLQKHKQIPKCHNSHNCWVIIFGFDTNCFFRQCWFVLTTDLRIALATGWPQQLIRLWPWKAWDTLMCEFELISKSSDDSRTTCCCSLVDVEPEQDVTTDAAWQNVEVKHGVRFVNLYGGTSVHQWKYCSSYVMTFKTKFQLIWFT